MTNYFYHPKILTPNSKLLFIPKGENNDWEIHFLSNADLAEKSPICSLHEWLMDAAYQFLDDFVLSLYKCLYAETTWLSLLRLTAARICGDSASLGPSSQAMPSQFLIKSHAWRRETILHLSIPQPLNWLMNEEKSPFLLIMHDTTGCNSLFRLSRTKPSRIIIPITKAFPWAWERELLTTFPTWFQEIEMARYEDKKKDEIFLQTLKMKGVVRGKGQYTGISIRLSENDQSKLTIELQLRPYLQEAMPGQFIFWDATKVVCQATPEMTIDSAGQILRMSVYLDHDKTHRIQSDKEPPLSKHAFVSGEQKVCTGETSINWMSDNKDQCNLIDCLISGRLKVASRVLRYGYRQSNTNQVHNQYDKLFNYGMAHTCYTVMTTNQANHYVAAHPEIELVRYQ